MSTENLNSYGNGLVKDLRNTLTNVMQEVKRQKLIAGQGVTLNHGPNGTTISVKNNSTTTRNSPVYTPAPTKKPVKYLKNVTRLSTTSGEFISFQTLSAYFTDSITNLSSMPWVYVGPYDVNMNGSIDTTSGVFYNAGAPLSGAVEVLSSFDGVFTVGIGFSLTMTNPGGDAVNAITNQIYFDWTPSVEIKSGDVGVSKSTSAAFIPIAKYGLQKANGLYSAQIENVNQYPTLITMIDQNLVNMLDNIEFNEE